MIVATPLRIAGPGRPRGVALRRRIAPFILTLIVAAVIIAARGSHAVLAPSAADSELLAVHAALSDVKQEFFRPVSTPELLKPAWEAVAALARKSGVSADVIVAPRLDGDDEATLRSFDDSFRTLNRGAGGKVDARVLGNAALAGVASSVHENHTYFIDPDHWAQRGSTSTRYAGIGLTLSQQGTSFYIAEVYADTPASRAGLRPGDRFVAVNGTSLDGLTTEQLIGRLRGDPGTTVAISVHHADGGTLQAELTREQIVVSAFESRVLDGGVGYIRLRSFPPAGAKLPNGRTVPQALDDALIGFEQAGVTAWVLDLRGDGGGYLDAMTEVANRLLPAGTALYISHTQGGDNTLRSGGSQHLPARPLSVLVNTGSASSSEILAVALQENRRASIVGDKSAGVANAANLDALPNGGGLSITSVQTLTPVQRRPLDGQGVTPDALIAGSNDDIPLGKDRQLDRAITVALVAGAATTTATP